MAESTICASILFGGGCPIAGRFGIRIMDAPDVCQLTYAIIENGRAAGADPLNKGGSIYIDNSSATLTANTIINNTAGEGETSNGGGVAILYSILLRGSDRVGFAC